MLNVALKGSCENMQKRLSKEQIAGMCARYESGENSSVLSSVYGISSQAICGLLKRRNIPRKNASEAQRIYEINWDTFSSIDTEPKAYWLGFLAADGNIGNRNELSVSLALHDKEHLLKLSSFLGSNHPIHDYRYSYSSFSRLCIKSKQLIDDLRKAGVTQRKTFTLEWPKNMDDNLLRHFTRGYMDGDGGFDPGSMAHPWNLMFRITGNTAFISSLQQFLMRSCNLRETKLRIRHPGKPISMVCYCGKTQVGRIATWLYADATVWLERKHSIAFFQPPIAVHADSQLLPFLELQASDFSQG
jgi:hypothetical protein